MRVLRDSGCLELTRTEPRRGAVEHYYRAIMPVFFDDEQWERVPLLLRRGLAGQLFRRVVDEAATAGDAGAFDVPGAHLDRMLVELDDRGWSELSDLLTDVMRKAQEIRDRSDARRGAADVRTSEVALLHFELSDSIARRSPRLP